MPQLRMVDQGYEGCEHGAVRCRISTLGIGLLSLLLGCGMALDVAEPELLSMSPGRGDGSSPMPVRVITLGLSPGPVDARLLGRGEEIWLLDPRIWPEASGQAVQGVLRAVVPAGMAPGFYDLEVIAPGGRAARLNRSLEVVSPQPELVDLRGPEVRLIFPGEGDKQSVGRSLRIELEVHAAGGSIDSSGFLVLVAASGRRLIGGERYLVGGPGPARVRFETPLPLVVPGTHLLVSGWARDANHNEGVSAAVTVQVCGGDAGVAPFVPCGGPEG